LHSMSVFLFQGFSCFFLFFFACHDSHELDRTGTRPTRGRGIYHTHSQFLH
jgi:hypothetical protein